VIHPGAAGAVIQLPHERRDAAMRDDTTADACDGFPARGDVLAHAWGDRDYSWLEFNRRVLHEAQDERTPLLERLKFLAIFGSNLDEFFMKRVGMLRGKARAESEDDPVAPAGDSRERLATIRMLVQDMLEEQAACYRHLRTRLAGHGVVLAEWSSLDGAQREEAGAYFDANVSPALTPLGFDPAHPFPFMSNLSTNWGFLLRRRGSDEIVPVRVKSPGVLPQWIELHANVGPGERRFVGLEDLIRHNAAKLFPGMDIESATLFRILRNAEVDLDEDEGETLRDAILEALRERRFQPVVRIDFAPGAAPRSGARSSTGSGSTSRTSTRPRSSWTTPTSSRSPRWTCPTCATRRGRRWRRRASPTVRATSSPRSPRATCWCTIRTRASTRRSSGSSTTPRTTRRRSPSR